MTPLKRLIRVLLTGLGSIACLVIALRIPGIVSPQLQNNDPEASAEILPRKAAPEYSPPNSAAQTAGEFQLPVGMVGFFVNASVCPPGWSPLPTNLSGRYVVGTSRQKSYMATVGTPLASGENRLTGVHQHTIVDPGHTHTASIWSTSGHDIEGTSKYAPCGGRIGPGVIHMAHSGIEVAPNPGTNGTNAPYVTVLGCLLTIPTDIIPSTMLALTTRSVCSRGWIEYGAASGRYFVFSHAGTPSGVTVGRRLGSRENVPASAHIHTVLDPGHNHANTAVIGQPLCHGGDACYSFRCAEGVIGTAVTNVRVEGVAGAKQETNAPYVTLRTCIPEANNTAIFLDAPVMFFRDGPPTVGNWSLYEKSVGRYVVAAYSKQEGGEAGEVIGEVPLEDMENRPVGDHTHEVIDRGHTHENVLCFLPFEGVNLGCSSQGPGGHVVGAIAPASINVSYANVSLDSGVADGQLLDGTNAPYVLLPAFQPQNVSRCRPGVTCGRNAHCVLTGQCVCDTSTTGDPLVGCSFVCDPRCPSTMKCAELPDGQLKCICMGGYFRTASSSSSCSSCETGFYRDDSDLDDSRCILCEPGTFAGVPGQVNCTACPAGTFATKGQSKCQPCPQNQTSDAGASGCVCKRGFYASSTGGATMCSQCPTGTTTSKEGSLSRDECHVILGYYRLDSKGVWWAEKCFPPEACLGWNGTRGSVCHANYTGLLCGTCQADYYRWSATGMCRSCTDPAALSTTILALVAIVLLVIIIVLLRGRLAAVIPFLNFVQMTGYTVKFPLRLPTFLSYASGAAFDMDLLAPSCWGGGDYEGRWMFKVIGLPFIGIGFVVLGALFWMAGVHVLVKSPRIRSMMEGFVSHVREWWVACKRFCCKGNDSPLQDSLVLRPTLPDLRDDILPWCFKRYCQYLLLLYLPLSRAILEVWSCTALGTQFGAAPVYILNANRSIQCRGDDTQTVWWRLMPWSIVGIFVIFLIPTLIIYIPVRTAKRRKALESTETKKWIGFIYEPYTQRRCYWEVVVVTRKLLIAAGSLFLVSGVGGLGAAALCTVVLTLAVLVHSYWCVIVLIGVYDARLRRPYFDPVTNRLEALFLVTNAVTLETAILIDQVQGDTDEPTEWASVFTVLLGVLNFVVVVTYFVLETWYYKSIRSGVETSTMDNEIADMWPVQWDVYDEDVREELLKNLKDREKLALLYLLKKLCSSQIGSGSGEEKRKILCGQEIGAGEFVLFQCFCERLQALSDALVYLPSRHDVILEEREQPTEQDLKERLLADTEDDGGGTTFHM